MCLVISDTNTTEPAYTVTEIPVPTAGPPEPACERPSFDIVLVVDASGSIGITNFVVSVKLGLYTFVNLLPLETNQIDVALVRFATTAALLRNLGDTSQSIFEAIQAMQYTAGGTNTADALNTVQGDIVERVPKGRDLVIIVFTDGYSNNMAATLQAASNLQLLQNTVIYAVAIGQNVNK